jgi:hypothetical protein
MKKISFLKNVTLLEIILNTILAGVFGVSGILAQIDITQKAFIGIVLLHSISMVLHWLAWNQLPVTHRARIIFNIWVFTSFALTFIVYWLLGPVVLYMLYMLALFAIMWFVCYCLILFKEFRYLKHKKDLYEKRELIHF